MRFLFAFIGYFCTATVIAAVGGLAFMWHRDVINDDKVFRMVALLHDVDIDKIAEEAELADGKVPPEELSLADVNRIHEVTQRNFEVKNEALDRGRQEFNHLLKQLKEATDRFDKLASDLKKRLEQQGELSTNENVAKVVRDLEVMPPDRAKELLLRHMNEPDGVNDVMLLMGEMSGTKLKKILERFEEQDDLDRLYKIHSLMLDGHPQKKILDEAFQMLNSGGSDGGL